MYFLIHVRYRVFSDQVSKSLLHGLSWRQHSISRYGFAPSDLLSEPLEISIMQYFPLALSSYELHGSSVAIEPISSHSFFSGHFSVSGSNIQSLKSESQSGYSRSSRSQICCIRIGKSKRGIAFLEFFSKIWGKSSRFTRNDRKLSLIINY